jgi:hypothetical protein
MIQVIPVDLFAGFTRFHTAGISTNNSTYTGGCVTGSDRNAWERDLARYARTSRVKCARKLVLNMSEEEWRQFCRKKVLDGTRKDLHRKMAMER